MSGAGFAQAPLKNSSSEKPAVPNTESGIENSDSWYGQTIFERERPEYKNEGVRAGSFKIKPTVQVKESLNTNIYATATNAADDFITTVKPGVSIQSDWSRHALNLNASGDIAYYTEKNKENYSDYSIGTSGRLDVLRETFILGSVSTAHLHEERGSPNSRVGADSPTEYNQNNASLSFIRNLRRIGLKLDGDYTDYNFQNDQTTAGTIISNKGRDRQEYKVTGRVGYEIIPEYEAFLRSSLNNRDYNSVDSANVNRDSSGYEVVAGTALNLGGKTKGEIFAGYMEQDYDSASLKNIGSAQFGGNVLWNATGLTSVKAAVVRGVQETIEANSPGYISTVYSLGVEHELLYNVLAGVNTSYSVNEYESTAATSRNDKIAGAGAELKYLLNRNSSIIGAYNYTDRDSNQPNQDYNQSIISLSLKFQM